MFITKKHLSRRTLLRGVGVSMALPFLESMVPAQTPLEKTAAAPRPRLCCIEMVHGSAGSTVDGSNKHYWSPEKDGRGFRMDPDARAARKISRLPDHHQRYGSASGGGVCGRGRGRRSFQIQLSFSHGRASQADHGGGYLLRDLDRSDVRAAVRAGYAAAVDCRFALKAWTHPGIAITGTRACIRTPSAGRPRRSRCR